MLYDKVIKQLADDEVTHKILDEGGKRVLRVLKTSQGDCGIFDIQNVADYIATVNDLPGDNFQTTFPNIAPPYRRFWMEFRPHFEHLTNIPERDKPERVGIFFVSYDREWMGKYLTPLGADVGGLGYAMAQDPNVHWLMFATIFFQTEGDAVGPFLSFILCADKEGVPYVVPFGEYKNGIPAFPHEPMIRNLDDVLEDEGNPGETTQEFLTALVAEMGQDAMQPSLLALSFMHCKGVTTTEMEQPQTRQARRLQERKGEKPPVRYHVLHIEPMKRILRDEGGAEETGITKALHICRGHFAKYTSERPLFGKFVGTVWREAHIRGRDADHVVEKTYAIDKVSDTGRPEAQRLLAGVKRVKGREVPK